MELTRQPNDDQATLWNGPGGRAWVELQQSLDLMFKPIEDLLVDAAAAKDACALLDVGCGTGGTTLAAARRLGPKARCVGVDISEPMIALARERAEHEGSKASFVRADAQVHGFEAAAFDLIVSRFGVMFFDDPVRAFANLRHAAKAGAELRLVVWRSAGENPFMTTAERAAAPLLPELPLRRPGAPGQFAFADRGRISAILRDSGWAETEIQPIDVACGLPESDLGTYLSRVGPVGQTLQRADESTRARVLASVRAAFDPYVQGTEVRFTAACWTVGARAV